MFISQLFEKAFQLEFQKDFLFEEKIKNKDWADALFPGKLLIEMKSPGKDLETAYRQAKERYWKNIPQTERPPFIIVCDFENFHVYDMNSEYHTELDLFGESLLEGPVSKFTLNELPQKIHSQKVFSLFLPKEQILRTDLFSEALELNRAAAEKIGKLHMALVKDTDRADLPDLDVLLIRLVFCLFAEDTDGIFEPDSFTRFLGEQTNADTIGMKLNQLFDFLNTKPGPRRERVIQSFPCLAPFPYVNGGLFAKPIRIDLFDSKSYQTLLDCTDFDWSQITPDLFGSIFQSAMDDIKRHVLGEHYTSPENVKKAINALFLDKFTKELDSILADYSGNRYLKLAEFQNKLASVKILDPACGCGNFLVVAYEALRSLELAVLEEMRNQDNFLVKDRIKVSIQQFYGIEIEDFPHEISQLSMWLQELKSDRQASDVFAQVITSIPLKSNSNIKCANAIDIDWSSVFPVTERDNYVYIVGNPPFSGNYKTTPEQRTEVERVFNHIKGAGKLDYVSAWFRKAANFMHKHPQVETAFVSTNSIYQGEQVYPLWSSILQEEGFRIKFFYQVFKWENAAKGKAAVHCVISGLTLGKSGKPIFYRWNGKNKSHIGEEVDYINAYGLPGTDFVVKSESKALSAPNPMVRGNQPTDNGALILSPQDYELFKQKEPRALPYIKKLVGSEEFLHNVERYCLWLVNASPKILALPLVKERISRCKEFRENAASESSRILAERPSQFRDLNNPNSAILIPSVSSERREYIPLGFIDKGTITTNAVHIVPNGDLYEFGILTSKLHMIWMRTVCGRLKSSYRYSRDLCYNTFPWPKEVSEQHRANIQSLARKVLDIRAQYKDTELADMYNPESMTPELNKAHKNLDKAVERLYNKNGFKSDTQRLNTLIALYKELKSRQALLAFTKGKVRKKRAR